MNRKRAQKLIDQVRDTRVIVFGDLILDEFLWGKVDRISPEAPVPVVWVDRESAMPGGAANVACNIQALGGTPHLIGVIGSDTAGSRFRELLEEHNMETDGVFIDLERPTTVKTRVVAHHQQVVRIDRERVGGIAPEVASECLKEYQAQLKRASGVIIEDYGKGMIHSAFLKKAIALARQAKRMISVDPKEEHISSYKGATVLTPNRQEASQAAHIKITDQASLRKAGKRLMSSLNLDSLLVTLGEEGMCLFKKGGKALTIPTVAREVFDVSGAGDTVIATFTLFRAAGATAEEAAQIANAAAGVVVGKVGTGVCTPEELLHQLFA